MNIKTYANMYIYCKYDYLAPKNANNFIYKYVLSKVLQIAKYRKMTNLSCFYSTTYYIMIKIIFKINNKYKRI